MTPPVSRRRRLPWVLAGLAVFGAFAPIITYWVVIGRTPAVSPAEAASLLAGPSSGAVLIDVMPPGAFARRHLAGARNWPLEAIVALESRVGVPPDLQTARVLLICDNGITSAVAAQRLRSLGIGASPIREGLRGWIAAAAPAEGLAVPLLLNGAPAPESAVRRRSSLLEQWVAVVTSFVVKPLYMLLALGIVIALWRRNEPDLAALRRAALSFDVGEGACALNYLFWGEQSHLAEFVHCYGMVLSFAFTIYALVVALDRRLIQLSDPEARCGAVALCRACVKHSDTSCGLERFFRVLIPSMVVLCFMLLSAEPEMISYNTEILGTPYNYSHAGVYQIFEYRFCAVYALVMLPGALVALLRGGHQSLGDSQALLAAGLGPLGFGLFRLFLFGPYRDNLVWFQAWEEITELLFIGSAAWALWVFRQSLFSAPRPESPRAP